MLVYLINSTIEENHVYGDNYEAEESSSARFTRNISKFFIFNGIIGLASAIFFYPVPFSLNNIYTLGFLSHGGGFILLGITLHQIAANDTFSIVIEIVSLIGAFISLVFWLQHLELMAWSSFVMIVTGFGALCHRSYKWSESDYD